MTSVLLETADTRLASRRLEVERLVVIAAVPLVFARMDLPVSHLTLSFVVVAALSPVWLGVIGRFEYARLLIGLGVLAVISGLWLAAYAFSAAGVNQDAAIAALVTMGTFLGAFGTILWARQHLEPYQIALLAGLGQLATVSRGSEQFANSPWRFGYSIPVTIIVLALAWWIGSRWFQLACLLGLAAVSMMTDSRSNFGMLILAAILLFVRSRGAGDEEDGARRSWLPTVLVVAGTAWMVFQAAQTLILGGYLGARTQERSVAQVDTSGSLILGGRPELAATGALMRDEPTGFGLGVVPTPDDVRTVKTGMASINYDPNNGYVERFMLGGRFELHSVFGDLWTNYGLAGLALCLLVVVMGVRGIALALRTHTGASALMIYLAIRTLWGVAFSPFNSASLLIALFLGLLVLERIPAVDGRAEEPVRESSLGVAS